MFLKTWSIFKRQNFLVFYFTSFLFFCSPRNVNNRTMRHLFWDSVQLSNRPNSHRFLRERLQHLDHCDLPTYIYYLSTYLPTNLPNFLSIYLPFYLPTNLPTFLPNYLSNYLRTYLYLHSYLHFYLPTFLPTILPTYLSIYLLTYLYTYLPT